MGFLSDLFGGGGGGGSSSSTSTSSTTNNNDRRTVADGGAMVVGDSSTVNTSDHGAIAESMDTAQAAILGATKMAADASDKASKLAADSFNLTQDAMSGLKGAYESSNKATITLAVSVGLVLWVMTRKKV